MADDKDKVTADDKDKIPQGTVKMGGKDGGSKKWLYIGLAIGGALLIVFLTFANR